MDMQTPHLRDASEKKLIRLAAFFSVLLVLAGAGFFGAYAFAGAWYEPQEAPKSEDAAAAEPLKPDPFASVSLIGKSAYVEDLSTGKTLYQLNANAQLPLASLTKIALVLAIAGAMPPDSIIATPATYQNPPAGGTARLPAGQEWRLQDAISFTLAASSDDGANLLATAANDAIHKAYPESPAEDATVWRMNALTNQLGLTSMYFLNDTGLDESSSQSGAYGSAEDVAALLAYAASTSPSTFAATADPTVSVHSLSGTLASAPNTDQALDSIPGLILGKTGYTDLAGGNLGVVFNVSGHRIVAVVLGSSEDGRFSDMKQLVAAAETAVEDGE